VDWTVARSFTVDHSFSIPHQLVVKPAETLLGRELPSIPVYLACGVDPYISLSVRPTWAGNCARPSKRSMPTSAW
jgi:hypothetical protein